MKLFSQLLYSQKNFNILQYFFEYIISKGPKYRFPPNIDFPKFGREISASLNDFGNRWCKSENVNSDALKEWRITFLKLLILVFHFTLIIHIIYHINLNLLFWHLKRDIQDFHMNYVLVPADKAANNALVV